MAPVAHRPSSKAPRRDAKTSSAPYQPPKENENENKSFQTYESFDSCFSMPYLPNMLLGSSIELGEQPGPHGPRPFIRRSANRAGPQQCRPGDGSSFVAPVRPSPAKPRHHCDQNRFAVD